EALYLSSVALTTVGFGDVVAGNDALRLVTTFESASGFGAITAAISYVLSLYPMLNRIRASAETASQLGLRSVRGAAAAVASAHGLQHALALHRDLVAAHHAVRRFPALFYFVADDERESIVALVEAAATMSAVLRWGVDQRRVPYAGESGQALDAALRALIDDYEHAFGRVLEDRAEQPQAASPALERLRADVASVDASIAASGDGPSDGFASSLTRTRRFIDELARAHGYRTPRPM
ncbi:MAG: potassium channel family protein, partial [Actinomycetota bacterium]|nr:potassium channel family protein [Actinomycetota bacterium]